MGIGKETTLSDHRPIYLHISLSKVQKGRGFWRLNGDFLTEPEYVFGCNNVIERIISQYSEQKNLVNSPELPDQEPASRPLLITHTLLHDILLLEVRAYILKKISKSKFNFEKYPAIKFKYYLKQNIHQLALLSPNLKSKSEAVINVLDTWKGAAASEYARHGVNDD